MEDQRYEMEMSEQVNYVNCGDIPNPQQMSCLYANQMEYMTETHNAQTESIHEEEIERFAENNEEQQTEMGFHQNAEGLLKSETKQFIFTKVAEDITEKILIENIAETERQIQHLKAIEQKLLLKHGNLENHITINKNHLFQLTTRVLNTGDIINTLKETFHKLELRFKDLHCADLINKSNVSRLRINTLIDDYKRKIEVTKTEIRGLKNRETNDHIQEMSNYHNKNLFLKSEILKQKQKNHNPLKPELEELRSKIANKQAENEKLVNQKTDLVNQLESVNKQYENIKKDYEIKCMALRKIPETVLQEKESIHKILNNKKIEYNQLVEENENVKLSTKRNDTEIGDFKVQIKELKEKFSELDKLFNDKQQQIEDKNRNHQTRLEESLKDLNAANERLFTLIKQKDELLEDLQTKKKEFVEKCETKNQLMAETMEIKNEIHEIETLNLKYVHEKDEKCKSIENLGKTKNGIVNEIDATKNELEKDGMLFVNKEENDAEFKEQYCQNLEKLKLKQDDSASPSDYFKVKLAGLETEIDNTKLLIAKEQFELKMLKEKNMENEKRFEELKAKVENSKLVCKDLKQKRGLPKMKEESAKVLKSGLRSPRLQKFIPEKKVSFSEKISFKSASESTVSSQQQIDGKDKLDVLFDAMNRAPI